MTKAMSIFCLVISIYAVVSFVFPLKARLPVKIGLTAFLLLCGQKFTFYSMFGHNMFNPQLDQAVLVIWESLFNVLLVLVPILVIKDVLFIFIKFVNFATHSHVPWPLAKQGNRWLILIFSLAAAVSGTHAALTTPSVYTVEILVDRLPGEFDGYRIVQMADLHVGQMLKRPWLEEVVDMANELDADMVVLTGDIIEGPASELKDEVSAYARLKAKDGVFAVTGNHEFHHGAQPWIDYFESIGIHMLENKHQVITRGEAKLVIAGTVDSSAVRRGLPGPDLSKALEGAPDTATVLLAHQPKGAREAKGVDLQLSGHTHGGLFVLYQPLIAYANDGFVTGLYDVNERMKIYVNPGTGLWTGMALRVANPSEITEIILRAPGDKRQKAN